MELPVYLGKLGEEVTMKSPVLGNIGWVPCNPDLSKNRLFDVIVTRDNVLERFVVARALLHNHGFVSNTIDLCDLKKIDVVIFYGISSEVKWLIKAVKENHGVRLINMPFEPPVVSPLHEAQTLCSMPFDRTLTWNDELVRKGLPFVKANIGEPMIEVERIPVVAFFDKRFVVAIYSNKMIRHKNALYEERLKIFDYFSGKLERLDLYGVGWDQSKRASVRTAYKGICESKKDILKNYKFSICFENTINYSGYITEKIFDCFAAGTVPIYYGAPNVQSYIPISCFIDFRDFLNYESLYQYLVNMPENEYQCYLDAARKFIRSSSYHEFTSKRYAEVVLEQIQAVMNETIPNRTVLGFKWTLLKVVMRHLFILKKIKGCRRFLLDLVMVW